MTRRSLILYTVGGLAADLVYYGRRSDEGLPLGEIQEALKDGEITIDEIVARFRSELEDRI